MPQPHHKAVTADDLSLVLKKDLKYPELIFCKIYPFSVECHRTVGQAKTCTPKFDNGRLVLAAKLVIAAKIGIHLRAQHHRIDRFRNKVVSAHTYAHNYIHIVGSRGDKDYRNRRNTPYLSAPIISVTEWQHYIHQYELRLYFFEFIGYMLKILCAYDLVSVIFKLLFHSLGKREVVFCHIDTVHIFLRR